LIETALSFRMALASQHMTTDEMRRARELRDDLRRTREVQELVENAARKREDAHPTSGTAA
jgi:hypothetical protein